MAHCRVWLTLSGRNDKHACHVVGAEAVLGPGLAEESMLESSTRIGQGHEVGEVRLRSLQRGPHTSDNCSAMSRSASRRYSPAMFDHPRLGARRDASAAMCAASSGLERTLLRASAIASGSSWSTTSPAPLESNSTAWGNAVATTGRPAAMASTRTPDVTWSLES